MISLEKLQQNFKQYLFDTDSDIKNYIVSTDEVKSDVRLSLYSFAYTARLIEALETDYPSLDTILGEQAFVDLCRKYIKNHPSTFFSLRWFGQYMPQFLRANNQAEYLVEIASLEWAFINSFDAADKPVINESDIATVPPDAWPALKIEFHPSVQVVTHNWNTIQLWRTAQEKSTIPEPARLDEPDSYLLWRDAKTTQYRYLEKDEAPALDAVRQGGSFVALCETLIDFSDDESEVPMRAASLLKGWLAAGLITGLHW